MEFISSPLYTLSEDVLDATTAPTTFVETERYIFVKETMLQLSRRLAIKGITGVGQLVAEIVDLIVAETREYISILFKNTLMTAVEESNKDTTVCSTCENGMYFLCDL